VSVWAIVGIVWGGIGLSVIAFSVYVMVRVGRERMKNGK
jgi:hypothetical protein